MAGFTHSVCAWSMTSRQSSGLEQCGSTSKSARHGKTAAALHGRHLVTGDRAPHLFLLVLVGGGGVALQRGWGG